MPKHAGGRPPIWDTEKIRANVSKFQAVWWKQIGAMMVSENDGERKFALAEFNKLQVKAMPQTLAGDKDNPIAVSLTGLFNAAVNEQ